MNPLAALRRASRSGLFWVWGLLLGAAMVPPTLAQQACETRADAIRFQDNGDGTVTDRESKLMWMRCSAGQQWRGGGCVGTAAVYGWADARQLAEQVNRDGAAFFSDWRVPALRELATLSERRCPSPRIDATVFPQTPAAAFWSSTPRPGEPDGRRILALSFGSEGVLLARQDERLHLRLVRTGP